MTNNGGKCLWWPLELSAATWARESSITADRGVATGGVKKGAAPENSKDGEWGACVWQRKRESTHTGNSFYLCLRVRWVMKYH